MASNSFLETIPCELDIGVAFGKEKYYSVVSNFTKDGDFRKAVLDAIKKYFEKQIGARKSSKYNVKVKGMTPIYRPRQQDRIGISCNMIVLYCAIDSIDETLQILENQVIKADGALVHSDCNMGAIAIMDKLVAIAFEKVNLNPITLKEANDIGKFFEKKLHGEGINEFWVTNFQIFEGYEQISISYTIDLKDKSMQEEIEEIMADELTIPNLREMVEKGIQSVSGNNYLRCHRISLPLWKLYHITTLFICAIVERFFALPILQASFF